jgi:hypothetical protein
VGEPVIRVDAKKKELIGNFATAGRQRRPTGGDAEIRKARQKRRDRQADGRALRSSLIRGDSMPIYTCTTTESTLTADVKAGDKSTQRANAEIFRQVDPGLAAVLARVGSMWCSPCWPITGWAVRCSNTAR